MDSFAKIGEHLLRVLRRVGLLHVLKKAVVNSGAVELLFSSNALRFCIGVFNVQIFILYSYLLLNYIKAYFYALPINILQDE